MKRDYHNPRVAINDVIREHIKAQGNRMGSVVFYKKDGSLRKMVFQLAAMPARILGTERGIQASNTRSLNHPNLLTVYEPGKGFRSVNLDTVITVKAGGKVRRYRDVEHVGPGRYALLPIVSLQFGREERTP